MTGGPYLTPLEESGARCSVCHAQPKTTSLRVSQGHSEVMHQCSIQVHHDAEYPKEYKKTTNCGNTQGVGVGREAIHLFMIG